MLEPCLPRRADEIVMDCSTYEHRGSRGETFSDARHLECDVEITATEVRPEGPQHALCTAMVMGQ